MMTSAQLEKAQKLTQECVVKNYKDCLITGVARARYSVQCFCQQAN